MIGGSLKSAVDGVAWPAIPDDFNARVVALLYQLERTQFWVPEQLQAYQLHQLVPLLTHYYHTSPFMQQRLKAAGYTPDSPVSLELFRSLPQLSRDQMAETGEDLFSSDPPESHGPFGEGSTSGSTGHPVRIRSSRVASVYHTALNHRNHLWHQRDFSQTMVTLRNYQTGFALPPDGGEDAAWSGLFQTGPSKYLNISYATLSEQLEWLLKIKPAYIHSYPTNLVELGYLIREQQIDVSWLKSVSTFSESLSPGQRKRIQENWHVPVFDVYSSVEAGVIAIQCPEHEHYLVQAEHIILEIVDDEGCPCSEGEVGHILLTDLHNFSTPVIRYRIGDLASFGAHCEKCYGLPVLERVYGRVRNMLRLKSGEKVFPDVASHDIGAISGIRRYQIVQTSYTEIAIRLLVRRNLSPSEEQAVLDRVAESLYRPLQGRPDDQFSLKLEYVDALPRSDGGKFEDFRCDIPLDEAGY